MNLKVYPGVVYRSQYLNLGLNFIYQKETENIDIRTIGTGRTPELLSVEGLWFYTSELPVLSGTFGMNPWAVPHKWNSIPAESASLTNSPC